MKNLELIEDLGYIYATSKSKIKRRFGLFKCGCGNIFKTEYSNGVNKKTKSCGCLALKNRLKSVTKHGLSSHHIYTTLNQMKNRCSNENVDGFKNYGGRGIKVCDEWADDVTSFYEWSIANGYKDGLSIDRIDNDGNYEPNNCRWVGKNIQQQNTRVLRSTNSSGYRGVSWCKQTEKWKTSIMHNSKSRTIGRFKCRLEAAFAYDNFVRDNNTHHSMNFK